MYIMIGSCVMLNYILVGIQNVKVRLLVPN